MSEFSGDGIGNSRAHGSKAAGERTHHTGLHFDDAPIPVGSRAGISRHNSRFRHTFGKFQEHALWIERLGAFHGA